MVKNLRQDTINHHRSICRTIYKFLEPQMLVEDITKKTVNKFVLDCMEKLNIKDVTLNTYVRSLRTILYYFMEQGYISSFKINAPKFDKSVISTYTDEELKKLLKKPNMKGCDFITYRNYVICNFFMAVGCRTKSLINIKISDLDFDNNVVYLSVTNNRKPLIIPLFNTIRPILKQYINVNRFFPWLIDF